MNIAWAARSFLNGRRASERMRRTGFTPNGHRLWDRQEMGHVQKHFPDWKTIAKLVPRRTLGAIKQKSRRMGLRVGKIFVPWMTGEVRLLTTIYPHASTAELMAALPRHSLAAIRCKARTLGLSPLRKRPRLKLCGIRIIDQIRIRAWEDGISLRQLDREARTRRYFSQCRYRQYLHPKHIHRAVAFFEGELMVDWKDE